MSGPGEHEGPAVIRAQLSALPASPGVYCMRNAAGRLLYVGKARNLSKRLAAYTSPGRLPGRIAMMVRETASLEVVTTRTEAEALLLEANMIRRLRPRYNILLRDDKSFPFIVIDTDHAWPRITRYRGSPGRHAEYFGPFPSTAAVSRTLATLERAFPLRSCTEREFASRTRPCLQYQIRRCLAPCVGRIDAGSYRRLVDEARAFLSGRSRNLRQELAQRMQEASDSMDYEAAAVLRDRLRALTRIQAHQDINIQGLGDLDVHALWQEGSVCCVQVMFYRQGQALGGHALFPENTRDMPAPAILAASVGQFYAARPAPGLVLVNLPLGEEAGLLGEALSRSGGRKVVLACPLRGTKRTLVEEAVRNAREATARHLTETGSWKPLLAGLGELAGMTSPPERVEIYDNSHIQGSSMVAAMVVFTGDGFERGSYRKFNITGRDITPGDDFGMMREVMTRRFRKLAGGENGSAGSGAGPWPDLLLLDGGQGQLAAARESLARLGLEALPVIAISKGRNRNAGEEVIHRPGRPPLHPDRRDPLLFFLQRLRDEAHRHVIGAHRSLRERRAHRSALDAIPGVGARRKKALLLHFGSPAAVAGAGTGDLAQVEGISRRLAEAIHAHFHGGPEPS